MVRTVRSDDYGALHKRLRRRIKKPEICEGCKKKTPYDLANISGEYKKDLDDWKWLCRTCHVESDGRLKKLHEIDKNKENNPNYKYGKYIDEKKNRKNAYKRGTRSITVICKNCGKNKKIFFSRIKYGRTGKYGYRENKFCSKKCSAIFNRDKRKRDRLGRFILA